MTGQGKLSTS